LRSGDVFVVGSDDPQFQRCLICRGSNLAEQRRISIGVGCESFAVGENLVAAINAEEDGFLFRQPRERAKATSAYV